MQTTKQDEIMADIAEISMDIADIRRIALDQKAKNDIVASLDKGFPLRVF